MYGIDNERLVRLAYENQNELFEGRVYLDYDKDEVLFQS